MLNVLGLIIDLALIAVAALILIINTKRGFLYSLTVLSGKIVSLIFAFFASRYINFIFYKPAMAVWSRLGAFAQKLTIIPYLLSVILACLVVIVRVVFRLIASATSNMGGKLGTANHVLGFVLGLAIAFVVIQIIAVVIYVAGIVIGIILPDIGNQITGGARFTRWIFNNNVLVSLIKSVFATLLNITGLDWFARFLF